MIDHEVKIAVIIPAYNVADYVEEAVYSVLKQPYEHLQIVCINDGSKDETLDVLKKLSNAHRNVHVLDQPNGGVSSARNNGIEYVIQELTCDYIMFLDGDDVWNYNWISPEVMDVLSKGYDIVGFDACGVDQSVQYRSEYHHAFTGVVEGGDSAVNVEHTMWQASAFRVDLLRSKEIRFHTAQKYGEDLCF